MTKIDAFADVERQIALLAMKHVDPGGDGKIVDRLAQMLGVSIDPGGIGLGFPGTKADLAAVSHLRAGPATASTARERLRTVDVGFIRTCAKDIHP